MKILKEMIFNPIFFKGDGFFCFINPNPKHGGGKAGFVRHIPVKGGDRIHR